MLSTHNWNDYQKFHNHKMHFENSVTKRYSRMKVMPPCIWGEQRRTINIFLSLIDAVFLLTLNHQHRSCSGVWTVVCCVGVQLFPLVTKTRWWSGYNQPAMEQNRVYLCQNCRKNNCPFVVNKRDQQNILGVQEDDLEVKLRNHCIVYVGHYKMERALWVGFTTSSVP